MPWESPSPPRPIYAGAYLSPEDQALMIELQSVLMREKNKYVTLSDLMRTALRDSHAMRVMRVTKSNG